jgi:hypothetical protein
MNTKSVNVVKYFNNYLTTSTLCTRFPLWIDLYQLHSGNNAQCEHNKDFYWIVKAGLIVLGQVGIESLMAKGFME